MGEKVIYEYCVLRYVADVEREEFVNVGLMMMSKRYRWLRIEIISDHDRIMKFFKHPDIEGLRRQLQLFCLENVPTRNLPVEERYRWLAAVKSACIQTSPSHPGIIKMEGEANREEAKERLDEKFQQLFHCLVE